MIVSPPLTVDPRTPPANGLFVWGDPAPRCHGAASLPFTLIDFGTGDNMPAFELSTVFLSTGGKYCFVVDVNLVRWASLEGGGGGGW